MSSCMPGLIRVAPRDRSVIVDLHELVSVALKAFRHNRTWSSMLVALWRSVLYRA